MESGFRFKAAHSPLVTREIAALRRVCKYAICDIKWGAATQESLVDIPILEGEWPGGKATALELLDGIRSGTLPLAIYSVEDGHPAQIQERITVEQAYQRLDLVREIGLEQDRLCQLEQGYIRSSDEYEPSPEDEL